MRLPLTISTANCSTGLQLQQLNYAFGHLPQIK